MRPTLGRTLRVSAWCVACLVYSHSAASESLRSTYRLGFEGVMVDQGLQIRNISPGSPVLSMRSVEDPGLRGVMDVGDVITEIDGEPVTSLQGYYQLMDASVGRGGSVVLTVKDVRNGRSHKWQALGKLVRLPTVIEGGTATPILRRAHFLLLGDTLDSNVGAGMRKNLEAWRSLATTVQQERLAPITVLEGRDCSAAQILATIQQMNVPSRDTIFCFFGSHGAHDPSQAAGHRSGGHYLALTTPQGQRRDLMRKSLSDALEAKGARLTVLITDTCNVEQRAFPESDYVSEMRTNSYFGLTPFEQLLFDYQGVVDISGSDFGQFGFCEPSIGGWYSFAAIPILREESDWRNAFERMQAATQGYFDYRKAYWINQSALHGSDVPTSLLEQTKLTPKDFLIDVRRQTAINGPAATAPREVSYPVLVEAASIE